MVTALEAFFPGLSGSPYRITSPRDADYNCVAWAAGDTHNWWWPGLDPAREYWPAGSPREVSRVAFQAVFATLGYEPCTSEALEADHEKIAVFATADGKPTHAARQLPSGHWSSKLGKAQDIEHNLHALEGELYGSVAFLMKRQIPPVTEDQASTTASSSSGAP